MYCPKCGAENADSNQFCHKCGAGLSSGGERNVWSPSRATLQPQAPQAYSDVYASFWARLGAYVIDYIVLMTLSLVLGAAIGDVAGVLVLLGVVFFYDVAMTASSLQGTLGKLALGVKVTDYQGRRISIARAIGRFFAEWITAITFAIGYVMTAFTERRQALHDKIAGTLVVRKSADEETVATAGPAGPVGAGAVVAIVLVATVPIIGILAAIAIPAYQDYTIRAQVSEGLMLAAAHKQAVSEAWNTQSIGFDQINGGVLAEGAASSGKYVESIEIHSGAVVITFGGQAARPLQGKVVTLIPAVNSERSEIAWLCAYANPPPGFEAVFENPGEYSDVPRKYLPSLCRGATST